MKTAKPPNAQKICKHRLFSSVFWRYNKFQQLCCFVFVVVCLRRRWCCRWMQKENKKHISLWLWPTFRYSTTTSSSNNNNDDNKILLLIFVPHWNAACCTHTVLGNCWCRCHCPSSSRSCFWCGVIHYDNMLLLLLRFDRYTTCHYVIQIAKYFSVCFFFALNSTKEFAKINETFKKISARFANWIINYWPFSQGNEWSSQNTTIHSTICGCSRRSTGHSFQFVFFTNLEWALIKKVAATKVITFCFLWIFGCLQ